MSWTVKPEINNAMSHGAKEMPAQLLKKPLLSHVEDNYTTSSEEEQPSLNKYYFSRGLLEKNKVVDCFITWDGPHNLRGVPEAHEGELVEPPGANVPNLHWAPFPLVHNLLPGVAVWTRENRRLVQKKHKD